jgi:hypothetical protein
MPEGKLELEGLDVVKYLCGHNSVRDGTLVSLSVQGIGAEPIITLVFEIPRETQVRVVKLELRDVQEFDYGFTKENPPSVIALVKCLMTDTGDFYLALDPYDENEAFVSDKDNEFFRSKIVKLTEQAAAG